MPFVQRLVEPVYLSRQRVHSSEEEAAAGQNVLLSDYELESVTNRTLSNALRQLASLVLIANDIFDELSKQLEDVCERSKKLRTRIEIVEENVSAFDPKKVTVPEGDMCSFSLRTVHFTSHQQLTTGLLSTDSRPPSVRRLYEAAAKTPVHVMRQLDRYRRDGHRSSRYFMCTPVLGRRRRRDRSRDTDIDIETHTPAAVTELRRWTSTEALGDVTVAPDCTSRVVSVDDIETDHRLPSPEEQVQAVAMRFPSEVVPVDISGRTFERMSLMRRSLLVVDADGTVRRRTSRRKTRNRRRNTIAGTDRKELREAVIGESQDDSECVDPPVSVRTLEDILVVRSSSTDVLRTKEDSKKSHFNSLKQWGKVKLKFIKSVTGDSSGSKTTICPEETNIYEMISVKGKKSVDLKQEKKSSSTGNSNIPISTSSGAMNMAVKLRHSSATVQRRQHQTRNGKDDAIHSSSGNWSASSESGRASIASENTSTTHQPKSTTTLSSAATSSNSLHHPAPPSSSISSRRKFLNTSTSSSVSEGTLTPDIMPDIAVPFVDDGETSSIYSCDTEGYYTSFHLDSGLKTLKEEDGLGSSPQTPLHSTTALSISSNKGNTTLSAENEYELFGKGSTSTTTSSAGTVCTTLMVGNNDSNLSLTLAPTVPERKSSLDRKSSERHVSSSQMVFAMVHKQEVSDSPDSGHNTSSSPVDSTSSPHGTLTGRSSEYEFSESDLEGVDRLERIRVKTTINSSRIPSMCVITPPPSDDETSLSQYVPSNNAVPYESCKNTTIHKNNLLETDFSCKNVHNLKLMIPSQQQTVSGVQSSTDVQIPKCLQNDVNTESDNQGGKETTKMVKTSKSTTMNTSFKNQIPQTTQQSTSDDSPVINRNQTLQPFNNMLDRFKCVLTPLGNHKKKNVISSKTSDEMTSNDHSLIVDDGKQATVDPGDYVTIADIHRNTGSASRSQPVYSNDIVKPVREREYVCLNELPVSQTSSTTTTNVLVSPSNSLERKRRQGARVCLDSDGKVVYSSDSLQRKTSHTTFEPGPYVKDTIRTPTSSPLTAHRHVKANIRPVTISKPTATNTSQFPKPSSPTSKKSQSPSRVKLPTSPLLGKVIIKAASKSSPMTRVSSPTSPTTAVVALNPGRPLSPQSIRGAYVNVQSPSCDEEQVHRLRCINTGRTTDEDEEGKSSCTLSPHMNSSPMKMLHSETWSTRSDYWTLPAKRTQEMYASTRNPTQQLNKSGSGRYNTIANTGNWHHGHIQQWNNPGYIQNNAKLQGNSMKCDQNLIPSHANTMPNQNMIQNYQGYNENVKNFGSNHSSPPIHAVNVPTIPLSNTVHFKTAANHSLALHSSTPTKDDKMTHVMNMSTTLSPIKKIANNQENYSQQKRTNNKFAIQPKSTMTSEELFAAIHKSKKKLNIKTETDTYGRSESPSCLSPINGGVRNKPGVENTQRNRHSWSPNCDEYPDARSNNNDQQICSPASRTRQSWACDRLGPIQQTSRNDFKKLLLQHGVAPSSSTSQGLTGRMSATEQLRLSRQQKLSTPLSAVNSNYSSRSPVDTKRANACRLLQSSKSLTSWRFHSPRTDVLSSTILEDCVEEERACNSSENTVQPHRKLPSATTGESSLGNTSSQHLVAARRQLNLSICENTPKETLMKEEILQHQTDASFPRSKYNSLQISNNKTSNRCQLGNNSPLSQELLSPSNVKENLNTNRQFYNNNFSFSPRKAPTVIPSNNEFTSTQLANSKAKQLFMQQSSVPSSQQQTVQHSSPRVQISLDKNRTMFYNSHGSPGRSILRTIETNSSSKSTLETAL